MKTISVGLEKVATGIPGLDEILNGGIPRHRTTLIMGEAGAGKTVLTLQLLANATRVDGTSAIFVGFEENASQLASNALSFQWDLADVLDKTVYVINARPHPDVILAGHFDLSGLLQGIKYKAEQTGATLIAFDSVDVVLSMLDDRIAERRELYRIHEWLNENGYTGIVTAKLQESVHSAGNGHYTPALSNKYVFLEFMADCVIAMNRQVVDHVALRQLRVTKYRGSEADENEYPFTLTKSGIELCRAPKCEHDFKTEFARISTGVADLDVMLEGGYYRRSSILITGDSGSGRTGFSAAFADAACRRGEITLYIGFGESSSEIVQCLARTGIDLKPHIKSGLLHMYDATLDHAYGEMHVQRVRELIAQFRPKCLVIDPLSAATSTGGPVHASWIAERLITFAKGAGITAVYTCLPQQVDSEVELEPLPIAAVIDTWIHLSNTVEEGERSRRLTIIKSRGTFTETTLREIIRTREGITLRPVFVRDRKVLTGQRRLEEEARQRAHVALWQRELEAISAQLLADKMVLDMADGEYPTQIAGKTSHDGGRNSVGRRASRKSVPAQRARRRRKEGTV